MLMEELKLGSSGSKEEGNDEAGRAGSGAVGAEAIDLFESELAIDNELATGRRRIARPGATEDRVVVEPVLGD